MRIRARHYATGQHDDVVCADGAIQTIQPATDKPADRQAGWVAPSLFDLQINGADGRSFNSGQLTREDIHHVTAVCRAHGIGAFCPTLITAAQQDLVHALTVIRQSCADEPELDRALPAIHVEGPYISAEDGPRGAHPKRQVRPPDWDEFQRLQDAAGGRIRLMTMAPETEGAITFIEKL